jgi:hypothetical protein
MDDFPTYRALAPECVLGLRELVCSLRFVPPFFAHLRSNPNNLPTAGLNRLDGVDGVHITRIRREFQCFRSKWPEKPAFASEIFAAVAQFSQT